MNKKLLICTIATTILTLPISSIISENKILASNKNNNKIETVYNDIYYANLLFKALAEEKENFVDPTYFNEIKSKFEDRGKFTLAGKVGAKALKEAIQRIGKTAWNNAIAKINKMTPWEVGKLHYDAIINFLNLTVNLSDNAEKILSNFLVRNGFNKNHADKIAWFVTFALF